MYRNTFVEVDIDKIQSNIKNITDYYNDYDYYFAVLKANAYGHGYKLAKYLVDTKINYFAVSSLEEAMEIREDIKDMPILILEPIKIEHLEICAINNITIMIPSLEYLKNILNIVLSKQVKVHIKLDTGMNRLGIDNKEELEEVYNLLQQNKVYFLEGIYTHFGTTGLRDEIWDSQLKEFEYMTKDIDLNKIKIKHLAKSATVINHPKIPCANGIRMGIILYGYKTPVKKQRLGIKSCLRQLKLNIYKKTKDISETVEDSGVEILPAMKVLSEIIQIKKIRKGESVGYGLTCIAKEDMNIAVVAIGYADGISVKSVNKYIGINSKKFKIIGTVTMNMIMVEVDEDTKCGDMVEVIGGVVSLRETAIHTKSNTYRVCTNMSALLPRVYKSKGKIIEVFERGK